MDIDSTTTDRWHIRAVRLPDGARVEEWWVAEGRLWDQPVPGARELPGGWVLPGLVDSHAHLSMDFNSTGLPDGDALIAANIAAQVAAGVLAIRDTGAVPGVKIDRLRQDSGPCILTSGRFLAPAGGYYAHLYLGVVAEDLVAAALAQIDDGATWVKIIADFPGPDGNWFAPRVNYPIETVRALVDAAHAAGARVAAHVSGPFVAELVRAGVDSIEHGPLVDADLVAEMANRGTAWTPTLTTVAGVTEQIAASDSPASGIAQEVLAQLRETIPLAAQLGVPILAGTDEAPHGAIAREVARLRQFGLTPAAAIAAASTGARAYLGLPALSTGAPADIVTFAADPRKELDTLAKPAAVLLGGRRVV